MAKEACGPFFELMLRPVLRMHDIRAVATAAWHLNVYIMSYRSFCERSTYDSWNRGAVPLQA